jgi:hypothetical protein
MTEHQGRRPRRLRAQRPPVLPGPAETARETAESVLPEVPRVGALDALLREVDSLRLSLETDLTLAAAAVEHGSPQVAADIIDGERAGLRAFEERALGHVAELSAPLHRRRFRVPAAPFVAAAAVAGFLLGVVPHLTPQAPADSTNASASSPADSYNKLVSAVRLGEQGQALDAANTLHAQLLAVVAQAKNDPAAALTALQLLNSERHFLASVGASSPALTQALAASQLLTNQIMSALPTSVKTSVSTSPTVPPLAVPSPHPTAGPSSKPASTTTAKPKSSTSPRPHSSGSAKPSPSPSSSSGTGLPGTPGLS